MYPFGSKCVLGQVSHLLVLSTLEFLAESIWILFRGTIWSNNAGNVFNERTFRQFQLQDQHTIISSRFPMWPIWVVKSFEKSLNCSRKPQLQVCHQVSGQLFFERSRQHWLLQRAGLYIYKYPSYHKGCHIFHFFTEWYVPIATEHIYWCEGGSLSEFFHTFNNVW